MHSRETFWKLFVLVAVCSSLIHVAKGESDTTRGESPVRATTAPATVTFVGSSATLKGFYPSLSLPPNLTLGPVTVIDPGLEFPMIYNSFSADIGPATITINSLANGNNLGCGNNPNPFSGFVFSFGGVSEPIGSVTIDPSSTLIPYNFWFTCNQVFVDYQCLGVITNNISTILNVTFDDDGIGPPADNCPCLYNPNQADTDADGYGDPCDCAPTDPALWALPSEPANLVLTALSGPGTKLTWGPPSSSGGNSLVSLAYDVVRSCKSKDFINTTCSGPPEGCNGTCATCLLPKNTTLNTLNDPFNPPFGFSFYYLVRAQNTCGEGQLGLDNQGGTAQGLSCP